MVLRGLLHSFLIEPHMHRHRTRSSTIVVVHVHGGIVVVIGVVREEGPARS